MRAVAIAVLAGLLGGWQPSEKILGKCELGARTTYATPAQCTAMCYSERSQYMQLCMKAEGYETKTPRLDSDACPGMFDYFAAACYEDHMSHEARLFLGAQWEPYRVGR